MGDRAIVAAAVQMEADLGNVAFNLAAAQRLVDRAFATEARLVVLPEFFPSGVGFHPSIADAALPLEGDALDLLRSNARQYGGIVGGSFIAMRENGERTNTFVLALPDGSTATHDKDLPTMWENCYYVGGSDDGVLDTPLGPLGAAMCWELVRAQTARRLRGRVDLVVAGSCWWTVPERLPLPSKRAVARMNERVVGETPARMARLVGAPIVHAAHAGSFVCRIPWLPGIPYRSHFMGETQIVDAQGQVLARRSREEGEGVVTATVEIGRRRPLEEIPDRFWIPRWHPMFLAFWHYQRAHGRRTYRRVVRGRTPASARAAGP